MRTWLRMRTRKRRLVVVRRWRRVIVTGLRVVVVVVVLFTRVVIVSVSIGVGILWSIPLVSFIGMVLIFLAIVFFMFCFIKDVTLIMTFEFISQIPLVKNTVLVNPKTHKYFLSSFNLSSHLFFDFLDLSLDLLMVSSNGRFVKI